MRSQPYDHPKNFHSLLEVDIAEWIIQGTHQIAVTTDCDSELQLLTCHG